MKTLRGVLGTILCLYALGFVVAHCSGCAAKAPESRLPEYCYDEAKLLVEVRRCTEHSNTATASRGCRKALYAACGIVETLSAGAHP